MNAEWLFRVAAGACALVVAWAAPAAGQDSPPRGYVQGLAGSANTSVTDSVFGGGAAFRVANRIEAFGELGKLRNGIWKELDAELATAGDDIRRQIATQFGTEASVDFDARVPIWYGVGGVRLRGPGLGPLGTYGEAGIGFARIRPEIHLTVEGANLDAEAGRLLILDDDRSELLSAVGAGISCLILRVVRIEGGYRYSRIHGDVPVNVHRVHGGLGLAF
ncbi:MAG TPA: outer membrane beta-barrel protein [Vicinamibacterales bacterium]|nr:outer membrane beta-barrel protein [Vicinamibacterales bacterium]